MLDSDPSRRPTAADLVSSLLPEPFGLVSLKPTYPWLTSANQLISKSFFDLPQRLQLIELLLKTVADFHYQTPLYVAMHKAIAQRHQRIRVNEGPFLCKPLEAALCRDYYQIVLWLLERRTMSTQGEKHGNALQGATSRDGYQRVQRLLGESTNVNALGRRYGNTLQGASAKGYNQSILRLLRKGVDVNARRTQCVNGGLNKSADSGTPSSDQAPELHYRGDHDVSPFDTAMNKNTAASQPIVRHQTPTSAAWPLKVSKSYPHQSLVSPSYQLEVWLSSSERHEKICFGVQ
jgi:hypothetical protein